MLNQENHSIPFIVINIIATLTIVSLAFMSFGLYLSFNIAEPILQHYNKLDGPIHQHYLLISLAYIATIPLFIATISQPIGIQENYNIIKHITRQYIIHTPIAILLITCIYFTRMEHPFITLVLFAGLIQLGIFTYGYQHIFNIANITHKVYEQKIKNLSQHAYIEHIRTTKIHIEPNPYNTLWQKFMLPPYTNTIKKMRYNRTITPNRH